MAKQIFVVNDDLFSKAFNSCDNNFACNECLAVCVASLKSIEENKQRRRCRSASNPNGFTSYTPNKSIKINKFKERKS